MRDLTGDTERLQVLEIVGVWRGVRNIGDRLGRLSDRNVRDHRVGCGVDGRERVGIFEPDIDARTVARRPHAVRKIADRDGRDLREIVGAEHLDFVQATDGDIGERSLCSMGEVHVVGDRAGVDRLDQVEWRASVEHLCLASVLQSKPDLASVRCRGNVRAERAFLLDLRDDLVIGNGNDVGLRIERRADVAVFAVGRKDLHARTAGRDDAGLLHERPGVEHGDVVLAAYGDPDLPAVGREERFMRRAADIGHVLDGVRRGVDEAHRVRSDRNHCQRAMIGRISQAMDENLPLVERAEIGRLRIPQLDHAEELVIDRVRHREGV